MGYYSMQRYSTPPVTKNLIITNIIIFLATLANKGVMFGIFALYFPQSQMFHWWQFVTYMFMHANFWHIFFNMYTLYIFGSVVEQMLGSKKFFTFYMLSGIGSAAIYIGIQALTHSYGACVGASGAIYGVLIAYAMLFPDNKMTLIFPPVTLSAKWMVIIFLAIELGTGVISTVANVGVVAHFAHVGGMLVGFLLMYYWRKTNKLFNRDIWI